MSASAAFPQCFNQVSSPNLKTAPLIQAATSCSWQLSKCSTWRAWTSIAALTPDDPPKDRVAIARAFVAKATWGMKTTRELLDRLKFDKSLRRMCGWVIQREVPSEATFSHAFAEFAATEALARVCTRTWSGKSMTAVWWVMLPVMRRRWKASLPGRQAKQRPSRMLADLPQECNVGRKANAKGTAWLGGAASCTWTLPTAGFHSAAFRLRPGERVDHLHVLMDSACNANAIRTFRAAAGRQAIIAPNPRRDKAKKERMALEAKARRHACFTSPSELRYRLRSGVELAYGRPENEFGGSVFVRGAARLFAHLSCDPSWSACACNAETESERPPFAGSVLEPVRSGAP
ncbi:MAG: transposase [Rhodobacteraceae bacterium]|nr:transposase [Paracoccaceae bacterium]